MKQKLLSFVNYIIYIYIYSFEARLLFRYCLYQGPENKEFPTFSDPKVFLILIIRL